jgi:hypothetical protein
VKSPDCNENVSGMETDIVRELELLDKTNPLVWQDSVLYYLFGAIPPQAPMFSDNLLL